MTDTETTCTHALGVPVVVEGDSPAGIAHARDVARAVVSQTPKPMADTHATTGTVPA
jgi:hypothetical protein